MHESRPTDWIWLPLAAVVAPVYAADYLTAEQAVAVLFPDADSHRGLHELALAQRCGCDIVTLTGTGKAPVLECDIAVSYRNGSCAPAIQRHPSGASGGTDR